MLLLPLSREVSNGQSLVSPVGLCGGAGLSNTAKPPPPPPPCWEREEGHRDVVDALGGSCSCAFKAAAAAAAGKEGHRRMLWPCPAELLPADPHSLPV